jgi:hypothetical protein
MRAAHGLVIVLSLAVGMLVWILLPKEGSRGMGDPARPDRGVFAPFNGEVPLVLLARIPGGAGRIVDLAADGEALAVLTRNRWYIREARAGEGVRGGFGDPVPGSPDWMARPVSIALSGDAVYVLDAGRLLVSVWDTGGVRRGEIPLRPGDELSFQPMQVLVGPGGELIVLSLSISREGVGRWEATTYGPVGVQAVQARGEEQAPVRVLAVEGQARSFIFHRPFLAPHQESLLGAMAQDQSFFRARPGSGELEPLFQRPDPPRWDVPLSQQRRYADILSRMGGVTASLSRLPEQWPSIRGLTIRPDGSFLLAVAAGEEHQHLELLDPGGIPLRRFNREGFTDPVFVHGGRAFMVKGDLNETVIYEFALERE